MDYFDFWHIWIIIGVIFFIVEVILPAVWSMCFGIGCFVAALVSTLGVDMPGQLLFFSISALVAFFSVRPLMMKYVYNKTKVMRTNIDALIGKKGFVNTTIDNSKAQGRAFIEGDDWRVKSRDDIIIDAGKKIEVIKVDSNILIVKQVNP